jgi:hypothetical protein
MEDRLGNGDQEWEDRVLHMGMHNAGLLSRHEGEGAEVAGHGGSRELRSINEDGHRSTASQKALVALMVSTD